MLPHVSKNVFNLKVLHFRAYMHEEIQTILQWSLLSIEGEDNRGRMDAVTNVSKVIFLHRFLDKNHVLT